MRQILIGAHRGAMCYEPENTVAYENAEQIIVGEKKWPLPPAGMNEDLAGPDLE